MSRGIRFRAWNIETKRTSEPFDVWNFPALSGGDVVLMQYTGLKDKNGKEIYEGDILESKGFDYLEVYWHPEFAGFYCESENANALDFDSSIAKTSEVIGNIYENSELLERTK